MNSDLHDKDDGDAIKGSAATTRRQISTRTAIWRIAIVAGLILCIFTYYSKFNNGNFIAYFNNSFARWRDSRGNGHPSDAASDTSAGDEYLLGVGKADITGPVVEINFMGYADPKQTGSGLRQRLYSRAFIVGSTQDEKERLIYLVLDTQSGDTAIRDGILRGLASWGREYAIYGQHNVAVTGTHSHSGPGAWLNYLLPQITSKGFNTQSYQAIVDGSLLSIRRAHESLEPGQISFASKKLMNTNINRSLFAYLANPEEERKRYADDVDKTMTLLRFTRSRDNAELGSLNWFPVHGTSMLGNNTLVTGDNKGVAARLFEKAIFELSSNAFVAGFSQSNVGDTSPNVLGAYCEDGSGKECSFERSLCDGKNEPCHGRGPLFGLNDGGTKSCFEIGKRQYLGAKDIYDSIPDIGTPVKGPVRAVHAFRDLSKFTFNLPNGTGVSTCSAALGYSFAAGTTDGPGAFDFKQNSSGKPDANPIWKVVRHFIHEPTEEQKECQDPKPILLDVGQTTKPYLWTPNIVDIQLFRIGQIFVIVSPGEATTMAGRRWKEAIAKHALLALTDELDDEPMVLLGGPANSYTHYITTPEEYMVQRYEGASTLYGRHTLDAYINLTVGLLPYLASAGLHKLPRLDPGPSPPIFINDSLKVNLPVLFDSPGLSHRFGDVIEDVVGPTEQIYKPGEVVRATFVGANPRNNLRLEGTFAQVVRIPDENATATVVSDDSDWELVYYWRRTAELLGESEVTLEWRIPEETMPGRYVMRYFGDSKRMLGGRVDAFVGSTSMFEVG